MTRVECDARGCINWSEKDGGICTRELIVVDEHANCMDYEEKRGTR